MPPPAYSVVKFTTERFLCLTVPAYHPLRRNGIHISGTCISGRKSHRTCIPIQAQCFYRVNSFPEWKSNALEGETTAIFEECCSSGQLLQVASASPECPSLRFTRCFAMCG